MRGLALTIVAVLALAAACTPFAAEPPASLDAGTGDSGEPDADAAGDGSVAVDGAAHGPCIAPLCEPFNAGWEANWKFIPSSPDGSLSAITDSFQSPPTALRLLLAPGSGESARRLIFAALPAIGRISAAVSVRVVTRGNGEIDFFGLANDANLGSPAAALVHDGATNGFVTEIPGPAGPVKSALFVTFAEWTRVAIELDVGARSYTFRVGEVTSGTGVIPPIFSPTVLVVGASFVTNCTSGWDVRFDDVAVSITPP